MRTLLAGLAFVATIGAGACTRPNAELAVALTASHVPEASSAAAQPTQLWVTVTEVQVHVVPLDENAAKPDDGLWFTAFSGRERLNLIDLAGTSRFLGAALVPAGRVTQIRLLLVDDAVVVLGGAASAVSCPSCDQTGFKIVTAGDLRVAAGGHLELTLDMDVADSLVPADNVLQLKPVIRIEPQGSR